MSGSITQLTPSQAAEQAAAAAALPSTGAAPSGGTSNAGTSALSTLGSNFNEFLSLLLTQLKNQDPTAPMDANQFTTELVQFTGVQQQVATNTSLTQLINLSQQSQVLTASQYVGRHGTVAASAIALQNGSGEVSFQGTAGQTVGIAIVDAAGGVLRDAVVTAQDGANTWTWNGQDNAGNTVPDGAYRIAIEAAPPSGGAPSAVPFDVIGTVTGITNGGTAGLMLSMGALSVGLSSVQSISAQ